METEVTTQTAGSPVHDGQIWTNIGLRVIASAIDRLGFSLSPGVIAEILRRNLKLGRRKISKDIPLGASEFRQPQFDRLQQLRQQYERLGWPILSVDTKKKELIGQFSRSGRSWTDGSLHAFDHDFGSYSSDSKAIPYGVYDSVANEAFVYLATGADTGELAADAVRRWWHRMGRTRYADAGGMLLLADCGGSNGYRVPLYRERLHRVAVTLGIPIRVAHLPPYCSKYNPIDHRLFCHLTRAISGRLVESLSWMQTLISKVNTRTGLKVVCELARKVYHSGIKVEQAFKDNEPTQRDSSLSKFNYVIPC
ncbi:ISAzo13 family transposase [Allorhodopirellula solitaria]|uniref:ISAzo13 family transposase n=1 Tax=Allorhodopirellula solitaria TaxID=2527987 RepID=UPI001FE8E513|nr:ISAzo13 family transposase [Allorhodopirellula solitaria]